MLIISLTLSPLSPAGPGLPSFPLTPCKCNKIIFFPSRIWIYQNNMYMYYRVGIVCVIVALIQIFGQKRAAWCELIKASCLK